MIWNPVPSRCASYKAVIDLLRSGSADHAIQRILELAKAGCGLNAVVLLAEEHDKVILLASSGLPLFRFSVVTEVVNANAHFL